jgi:hypothetical protein
MKGFVESVSNFQENLADSFLDLITSQQARCYVPKEKIE